MTFGSLLRRSVELLWQHPRLLLPVLLADGMKYVLLATEKPARIAVEAALLPRSVLGGYGGAERMSGNVVLIAGVMNWTTYFICILGYVVALGILVNWVPLVQKGETSSLAWRWPHMMRTVSFLLLGCMFLFAFLAAVMSWFTNGISEGSATGFYVAFACAAMTASAVFGWFVYPFVCANGAGDLPEASRLQSMLLLLAGVALSLAMSAEVLHESGRDVGLNLLLHQQVRWVIGLFLSLLAAIPYALSFVGMSLRSDQVEMVSSPLVGEDECFE